METVVVDASWADRALCPWCLKNLVPPVIPDLAEKFR